jgi:hypothetical protein
MYQKPQFTHTFLDTDTVTVRNKGGIAITFSIQTDSPIDEHDRMLRRIRADGWGKMHLVLHEPHHVDEVVLDPNDRRDNVVDGGYDAELIKKWYGIEWAEFVLMYNYARLQIIIGIEERMSALSYK